MFTFFINTIQTFSGPLVTQTLQQENGRHVARPYLSPVLALRCVELQAQQSCSDHAQPVDIHHILCILTLEAKNTTTHKNVYELELFH